MDAQFGPGDRRLYDAERKGERVNRSADVRKQPPRPWALRVAIHRAITVDPITRDTPGTVKLVYYNGADYTSADSGGGTDVTVECGGFALNTGESIAADTAGFIIHMLDNTWEWFGGNCAVRDWELADEGE